MKIKDQDRLKSWLIASLKSICIAKFAILAKYIIWLLKIDQSINELKKLLLSRLEKFLNNKTETFVTLLVGTLQHKSYLNDNLVNSKTDKSTDDKKFRSMSRSLIRSTSLKTKDTMSTRYRRDYHIIDEDKEKDYRKYR